MPGSWGGVSSENHFGPSAPTSLKKKTTTTTTTTTKHFTLRKKVEPKRPIDRICAINYRHTDKRFSRERLDGRTDRQTDATKYIISLALRSIKNHGI